MKRASYSILTLALILALLVVGCSSPAPKPEGTDEPPETPGETRYIRIGGGGTGGVYFMLAAGLAQLAEKHIPNVVATSEVTNATMENLRRLGQSELQFGLAAPDATMNAYNGEKDFATTKYDNLRYVMRGHGTSVHIVCMGDSPIKTIPDLRGKRVGLLSGATADTWFPAIIAAYDMERTDYKENIQLPAELFSALQDGHIDAAVYFGGVPTTSITDICTGRSVRFIPIEKDIAEKIVMDHPYFYVDTIATGTYPGQNVAVPTIGMA